MIRRTRTLALTLALTCAAFAAQATPPDAVTLTDQLFGISAEKVSCVRTILSWRLVLWVLALTKRARS